MGRKRRGISRRFQRPVPSVRLNAYCVSVLSWEYCLKQDSATKSPNNESRANTYRAVSIDGIRPSTVIPASIPMRNKFGDQTTNGVVAAFSHHGDVGHHPDLRGVRSRGACIGAFERRRSWSSSVWQRHEVNRRHLPTSQDRVDELLTLGIRPYFTALEVWPQVEFVLPIRPTSVSMSGSEALIFMSSSRIYLDRMRRARTIRPRAPHDSLSATASSAARDTSGQAPNLRMFSNGSTVIRVVHGFGLKLTALQSGLGRRAAVLGRPDGMVLLGTAKRPRRK